MINSSTMKKVKKLFEKTYFILCVLLCAISVSSCTHWDGDIEFRNYLRDRHPYSEIKEIDLLSHFSYQVNDTIRGEIWVYTSYLDKCSVKSVCVSSDEKKLREQ